MDFILAFWQKQFEPFLDALWNSLQFWRVLSLISVTAIILTIVYKEKLIAWLRKDEILDVDRKLFADFVRALPTEGAMTLIREHDFLSSFDLSAIHPVQTVVKNWESAERVFHTKSLEDMRVLLFKSAGEFLNNIAQYTSPTGYGRQSVIPRGVDEDNLPKYLIEEARKIDSSASSFYEQHQRFIAACRKELRV